MNVRDSGELRDRTGLRVVATVLATLAVALACSKEARPSAAQPVKAPRAGEARGLSTDAEATAEIVEKAFELRMVPVGEQAAGREGRVDVVLTAKDGYKCNDKYPYKMKLRSSPGISYPSPVVRKDALTLERKRAVMRVKFVPDGPGERTIAGQFAFSVCTEERCLIEKRDLALVVSVR